MKLSISFITLLSVIVTATAQTEKTSYYFDSNITFNKDILSPEEFLGYQLGSKITEHSRINDYYKKIAELSDRAELIEIGKSHEQRPIYILAISSPENIRNLNNIKVLRQEVRKGIISNSPLIIFLGNAVHGNEISSSEASLLSAYYYSAAQDEKVLRQLDESIIFIDPVRNPDGQERFASWVNSNISFNRNNISQYDREHTEGWPNGRGNHYWFDLNRDWISIVNPESRARVEFYQEWLPHVQADHHEMGANTSFFFEPTDPDGNESHLIPKSNYELNRLFADYFADALNKIGSFYYTKESYDNKNPNFGSTYPDFNGGVGILFEQASSRGLVQESENGLVTLPFTIRNQLVTTIATVDAANGNRKGLFDLQYEFFTKTTPEVKDGRYYVIGDNFDKSRLRNFINLLLTHKLDVYENISDLVIDSVLYEGGKSYIIPAGQANSALVGIIFDDKKDFNDVSKLSYGAGFSIAYSTGLQYGITNSVKFGEKVASLPIIEKYSFEQTDYAYLVDFRNSASQQLLLHLLEKDILVKTATKPFSINEKEFSYGSLLIPVRNQNIDSSKLYEILKELSENNNVEIIPVTSGLSQKGVDLGSSTFRKIEKPKVLVITGAGISSTEAGEVWHLFDQKLKYPLTRVNYENLSRVPLNEFNRVVLVSGSYDFLNQKQIDDLKIWIRNGGTLITINEATRWAVNNNISDVRILELNDSTSKGQTSRSVVSNRLSERLPSSIFMTHIDLSHPLAFGLTSEKLPVTRENSLYISTSDNTVSRYIDEPLLNGFISSEQLAKLKISASISSFSSGRGSVIHFTENPLFRGFWDGTGRTFVNAILLGNINRGR